jgi:hypothetical protein
MFNMEECVLLKMKESGFIYNCFTKDLANPSITKQIIVMIPKEVTSEILCGDVSCHNFCEINGAFAILRVAIIHCIDD